MKKFFSLLVILSFLFAADGYSQNVSSTVVKVDTAVHPTYTFRWGTNKLDSQLVFYNRTRWYNVPLTIRDTATLNFASAGATTVSDLTKTISGAQLGDEVIVGAPHGSVTATATYWGWVSAANTVTIRFSPKATEDPASGVFHITVVKYQKWR